jgi:hypothetical protein
MKIAKHILVPVLTKNSNTSQSAAEKAQIQIINIESIATDNSGNKGKAYDSFRAYIDEVRVPVLKMHLQFYSQFNQDIKDDLAELEYLPWGINGLIDTVLIELEIISLNQATFAAWTIYSNPITQTFVPGSADRYQRIKAANDEAVQKLRDAWERAEQYANNTTLYAGTKALALQLDQATQTLSEVSFDSNTGIYDLSGITNTAWKDDLEKKYWEHYNYVLLGRYFILDEDGNLVGIRPEALGELQDIINRTLPYATNDEGGIDLSDVGSFADGLSYDEKYLLLYLSAKFGDEAFEIESFYSDLATRKLGLDLNDLFDKGFGLVDLLDGEGTNLITNYFSFVKQGGKLTGADSPNSFQANGGFCDVFDLATKFLGMDIDTHITVFTYGGKEYRLQVWDGQYVSGQYIGGEIGLYARSAEEATANPYIKKDPEEYVEHIESFTPTEVDNMYISYESVKGDDQIHMILNVVDESNNVVVENNTKGNTEDGTHYWDFAIEENPAEDIRTKDNLHIRGDLTFEESDMRAAAKDALIADGHFVEEVGNVLKVRWE